MTELPPKPDIKQSKNKSEPQALGLAGGVDISNLSMLLGLSLHRLSKKLPPKSNVVRNSLTRGLVNDTIFVVRAFFLRTSYNKRLSEMAVGVETRSFLLPSTSLIVQAAARPIRHFAKLLDVIRHLL